MRTTILLLLTTLSLTASAQGETEERPELQLTLGEVIRLAQERSPSAIAARHTLEAAEWNYRFYKANYLPSVTLESNPSYSRSINKITQPDGTYNYLEQNSLSTDLSLSIRQNIALTGGTFSVTSSAERLDLFKEGESSLTSYSTQPVYIGYSQSLFGLNSLKWDRRIQPVVYREACKQYNETMELVASQACNYFFALAKAQADLDIASFNHASADTLYRFAQGRYNIGTITENEMLQLEVNKLNEEANRINAQFSVEDQMQSLRSYLGLHDNVDIRVVLEDSVPHFIVSADEALTLAYEHSPDPEYFKYRRLQSDRNLASAKANAGLKANIYLQFGLTQTGNELKSAYRDPINSQAASISLSLPILDWGRGRGQVKVARSNRELTYLQVEQSERDFKENVQRIVRQFNQQAAQMTIASKTDFTAERRYEVARRLYLMGKSTILDLNAATSEKDTARRNHISALSNYWSLYYTLRSLTGYDFERKEKIEYGPHPDLPQGEEVNTIRTRVK
ncbi:MAG: TolC family protein [Bacteroidaceae bacterium]|nr:TolC family protein [Bacteroidaceae bacterium]